MRLSKKFLSDYIDLNGITMDELAKKMVFAGNEYEKIEKLCDATGLVVGNVIECKNHPESDHLHICQVDIGDEIKQIVCGAPNVRAGIKVIVATIGAVLPDGTIKDAILAGVPSQGMICSLAELGLDSKFLTEEDKTGIHILNDDAIVGEDVINYLGLNDTIIDFELTADRADLMNVLGMAYEVGAIYNRKVQIPEFSLNENSENVEFMYDLDVKTDMCPIYLGKLVRNVVIKESPNFIKTRLMASGIRPINNVVDISNYVMLEYGQPLHFFDADKLGKKVIVRNALEGELITTLDGNERVLKDSDIVIANEKAPVALAGVMGGLSTEVENDTKNIFIESAIFNQFSIRKTSHRILRSEASSRYERGIDPSRTEKAIKRAAYLLNKYAQGEIVGGIVSHNRIDSEDKKIDISINTINSVLGMELTVDDVKDIFSRLDFKFIEESGLFKLLIPTRRLDINIKEDLIEEIGRIYGYEHMEGIMPVTKIKKGSRTYKGELKNKIRNRLTSLGLYQVYTYSLINENQLNKFVPELREKVEILSPMSDDKKILRQSMISSLINVYDYNISRNIKDINIFEIGSVYYKNEEYIEETKVSGLLSGNFTYNNWQNNNIKVDFYVLKGIIENLLEYLGYANRYSFDHDTLKDLHPGISCSIKLDGEIIGYMGKVHPLISKKDIYVFEFSLDKLLDKNVRLIKYKEISKYPTVNKDLAFVVKKDVESDKIMNILKKVGGRLLNNIDVFDVYTGENVNSDEKSLAYSLTFQNSDRTLTDEEVTEIFNKMITEVETKVGARLRDK